MESIISELSFLAHGRMCQEQRFIMQCLARFLLELDHGVLLFLMRAVMTSVKHANKPLLRPFIFVSFGVTVLRNTFSYFVTKQN